MFADPLTLWLLIQCTHPADVRERDPEEARGRPGRVRGLKMRSEESAIEFKERIDVVLT